MTRERAVAAIESGHTREEVAEFYNLALSAIGGFIKRKRETGSVSPGQIWWPQDICACTAH
jgi:transposase